MPRAARAARAFRHVRRRGDDRHGPGDGHGRLHGPGTGLRQPHGRHPRRHLQPGLHALQAPQRPGPVQRPGVSRHARQAQRPRAASRSRRSASFVPDVPDGLAAILDRMLAKDPDDRFATPAEVAEALAPWCAAPTCRPCCGGRSMRRCPLSLRERARVRAVARGQPIACREPPLLADLLGLEVVRRPTDLAADGRRARLRLGHHDPHSQRRPGNDDRSARGEQCPRQRRWPGERDVARRQIMHRTRARIRTTKSGPLQ